MDDFSFYILILGGGAGVLLLGMAGALFFVSRRSQRVMGSLLDLLLAPERAKIQDAANVVKRVMNAEVEHIEHSFKKMSAVLDAHIQRADALEKLLRDRNSEMVALADTAVKNIAVQTNALEKQLKGFYTVLDSKQWKNVSELSEKFQNRINGLLDEIKSTVQDANEHARVLKTTIDGWVESGKTLTGQLQSDLSNNTSHMNSMVIESDAMREKLTALANSVRDGFAGVKQESADYEKIMTANEKLLARQLEKMDAFTKQSKTLLVSQMNGLTSTANVVGGQIRLA